MADTEQLVLSISADVRQMQRALDRMVKETGTATKQVEGQFDHMSKNVIDASKAFDRVGASATRQKAVLDQTFRSNAANVQNLRFQLNDIATGLASGQSPFQVMSQQLSQVTQSLGGAGLMGGLRLIGSALANPLTIATVAFTTLAGVAANYFASTEKDAEAASNKLGEHVAAVKAALATWEGAPPQGMVDYVETAERLAKLGKDIAAVDIVKEQQVKNVGVGVENLAEAVSTLADRLETIGDPDSLRRAEALRKTYAALVQSIKDGKPSVEAVETAIRQLNETQADLGNLRGITPLIAAFENLLGLIKSANTELRRLDESKTQFMPKGPTQVYSPLGGLLTQPGESPDIPGLYEKSDRDLLRERAVNDVVRSRVDAMDEEFVKALAGLLRSRPNARILSGVRTTAEQAAIRASGVRPAARPGSSLHESGQAADISGITAAELQSAVGTVGFKTLAGIGDPMHVQLIGEAADETNRLTTATVEAVDAWDGMRKVSEEWAKAQQDAAAAQREAAAQMDQYGMIAAGAIQGLVSALQDGKLEGQELLGIIGNIADQLISMSLQNLFTGGQQGGGILGALIGGIGAGVKHAGGTAGGFGPMRNVPAAAFIGAQRYHSGGMAGIRPGEIPAILQRGEVVLPKGARMGGSSVVVNNYSKAEVQAREAPGGKGFEIVIEERIADRINTRGTPANKAVRSASSNQLRKL